MQSGAITGYIDVAQLALYVFWGFFALLLLYLRREDKREGYPLLSDRSNAVQVQGFPELPKPKVFNLHHGGPTVMVRTERPVAAVPSAPWPGAPLIPTGNPMVDGVGPAAYAERSDEPDMTFEDNVPKIVPLRVDPVFFLATEDPDPRGMTVIAADGKVAGTVRDAWIDRSEVIVRYLEVSVPASTGVRNVLVPMTLARVNAGRRQVRVKSVLAWHFDAAPVTKNPDQVTLREEDRIMGYFGGGNLYATPSRMGPLL